MSRLEHFERQPPPELSPSTEMGVSSIICTCDVHNCQLLGAPETNVHVSNARKQLFSYEKLKKTTLFANRQYRRLARTRYFSVCDFFTNSVASLSKNGYSNASRFRTADESLIPASTVLRFLLTARVAKASCDFAFSD